MFFEEIYEDYKIYVRKRHKKQGFVTICQDFENHILPYFKGRKICTLTKVDIIDWQNRILDNNFSNKYNSKLFYVFSSFVKYCVLYGYIEENVVLQVGSFKKKIEIKEHTTYTLNEFRKFRFYLEKQEIKQYFNFMYFYGTRPSEAMALRFSDLEGRYVHIRHSIHRKGKRELDTPKNQSSLRTIKISLLAKYRLLKLKSMYESKFGVGIDYFIFGGINPLSPTTIDRYKKRAYEKAHLKNITQHEFRHSYATRMIHKKIPIDFVSRSMGHSKVSTTVDVYLHP